MFKNMLYIHIYVITIKKVMNLKEGRHGYMGGFQRRKGKAECFEYIVISKIKKI